MPSPIVRSALDPLQLLDEPEVLPLDGIEAGFAGIGVPLVVGLPGEVLLEGLGLERETVAGIDFVPGDGEFREAELFHGGASEQRAGGVGKDVRRRGIAPLPRQDDLAGSEGAALGFLDGEDEVAIGGFDGGELR